MNSFSMTAKRMTPTKRMTTAKKKEVKDSASQAAVVMEPAI